MGFTKREAKQVIADLMDKHRVPRSIWSLTPGGELHILIGSRKVEIATKAGLSYYAMRSLEGDVEAAIRDWQNMPDRRQMDIEDMTRAHA
jgi:hypothetical protein